MADEKLAEFDRDLWKTPRAPLSCEIVSANPPARNGVRERVVGPLDLEL